MHYSVHVIVLVLLLFIVNKGFCDIKCYICSSKHNGDCAKLNKNKIFPRKCNMQTLQDTQNLAMDIDTTYGKIYSVDSDEMSRNIALNCLKHVTRVGNKKYVIRGCQLAVQDHLDICNKIRESDSNSIQTEHCVKCGYDGCNTSVPKKTSNLLLIFMFTISSFLYLNV